MKTLRRATVALASKGAFHEITEDQRPNCCGHAGSATEAALAQMSNTASAGPTANVVDADYLFKLPPYIEQFWKRAHTLLRSLTETTPRRGLFPQGHAKALRISIHLFN